jgi:hypothetical protein
MTGHGNNLLGVVVVLGARHGAGVGWPGAVLGPRGSGSWVSFPRHARGVVGVEGKVGCGCRCGCGIRGWRRDHLMRLAGGVEQTRWQVGGVHMSVSNCDGAAE